MTGRVYRCRLVTGETLEIHAATPAAARSEAGPHCVAVTRPRVRHTVCKVGAAVRLHGYAPARVVALEYERTGPDYSRGVWYAECVITARGPDWRAGRIGPHGYRPGERVTVRAGEAVPRDTIRVARGSGRLTWGPVEVQP